MLRVTPDDWEGSSPGAKFYWTFGDGGSDTGPECAHVFKDPGIFTVELVVEVDGEPSGRSTTTVEVSEATPSAALASPRDAQDSGDDTPNGATTLTVTTTQQTHGPHTLTSSDQYDWFKVSLSQGNTYVFSSTGSSDTYGELYSSASTGNQVAHDDDAGTGYNFSLTYTPTTSSWYYLRVRGYNVGSNCSYSFVYQQTGSGGGGSSGGDTWDSGDDTPNGATTLTVTTTQQTHGPHTLTSSDQYDWFKVSLSQGNTYVFSSTGSSDTYGQLYSSASTGNQVAHDDDAGTGYNFSLTYTPTTSGWYYLRVRGYNVGSNCSYSFVYQQTGSGGGGGATIYTVRFDDIDRSLQVVVGDAVTIRGVVSANGSPASGLSLGVEDGLARVCQLGPTSDQNGRFAYTTRATAAGACEVAFLMPDGRKIAAFVNVISAYGANGVGVAGFRNLYVYNPTSTTRNVSITVGDVTRQGTVLPGQTTELFRSQQQVDHFPFRVSSSAGMSLDSGLINVGETIDSDGVITVSVTAGELWVRGRIYVTSSGDFGACWAPGVSLPVFGTVEGMICLGTDGVSTGVGASSGGVAVGLSVRIWDTSPSDTSDPGDNTPSGATTLTVTTTQQTHGPHTLTSSDQYDWFKVSLSQGNTYVFSSTGSSDTYGELYSSASTGNQVAHDDDAGTGYNFSLTYTPTTSGWYYLRVRGYNVGSNCSYSLVYYRL